MSEARHSQITQNNKSAISLRCFKTEVSDEVDFLHTDKHERFQQINTMILDGVGQTFPKSPKQQICNVFTIIQESS